MGNRSSTSNILKATDPLPQPDAIGGAEEMTGAAEPPFADDTQLYSSFAGSTCCERFLRASALCTVDFRGQVKDSVLVSKPLPGIGSTCLSLRESRLPCHGEMPCCRVRETDLPWEPDVTQTPLLGLCVLRIRSSLTHTHTGTCKQTKLFPHVIKLFVLQARQENRERELLCYF